MKLKKRKKNKRILKILLSTVALLAVLTVGFFVGRHSVVPPTASDTIIINRELGQDKNVDFSLFWQVLKKIERDFADKDKIDYQKILYGAISGMTASLDDPYSVFMEPKKTESFLDSVDTGGSFEGVGMEIGIKGNILTIVTPLDGTPAMRAGVKAGDKILKIDDQTTEGLLVEEAVSLIRGERGTKVDLTIARAGDSAPREISIIRDKIQIPVARWELKETSDQKEKIAYVKLYQFAANLPNKFKEIVTKIKQSGAQKIIIDLRNNPGGYLEVATDIASWFLPKGEIVAIEDYSEQEYQKEYRSRGYSGLQDFPVTVLINGGSASAAEILAGALRDIRGIKLIGHTSFGKGSVQTLEKFSDGSALKITIARWLTPSGLSISKEGLTPDSEIKITEEENNQGRDPQLEEALKEIEQL